MSNATDLSDDDGEETGNPERERRGIQSIETGSRLLLALSESSTAMTLTDLARAVGISPTKAYPYLVSFAKPPVTEVALTVQFAGEAVDLDVLADFRRSIKEEFPQRERQPALPPIEESFDSPPQSPSFQIHFSSPSELPRTWFLTKDGARLIQAAGRDLAAPARTSPARRRRGASRCRRASWSTPRRWR